ncbi:MAG: FAD-binding domain-containing protein [Pseudomonadota bacterium]|nr:FAD-binding domain-containing protein [Pseudomonadota bacterium]
MAMPQQYIHTPWMMPSKMNGYPMPIVDEKIARKAAADKLYPLRQNSEHKEAARKIVSKHASRKLATSKRAKKEKTNKQTIRVTFMTNNKYTA